MLAHSPYVAPGEVPAAVPSPGCQSWEEGFVLGFIPRLSPAYRAVPSSMSAIFHMGCTEKGDKWEKLHLTRTLRTTSFCRQKHPQHSHGGKQSGVAGLLCCPMPCQSLGTSISSHSLCHWSECHICPRMNSPVLLRAPSPCTQTPGWPVTCSSLTMEVASQEATPVTLS